MLPRDDDVYGVVWENSDLGRGGARRRKVSRWIADLGGWKVRGEWTRARSGGRLLRRGGVVFWILLESISGWKEGKGN